MNLSIKNYKRNARLSEETDCFSATICLDGVKVGEVGNRGCGGANEYHWVDRAIGLKIQDWAKTQPTEFDFEQLDQILDDMIQKVEAVNQIKRRTKKTTWFRLPGDKKGEWRIVKAPYDQKVKDFIVGKYPTVECIANENPELAATFC